MAKQIHWYPGHMKKAQIQIEEKLKIVDCLIELLDARIPVSSRNNSMYEITKSRPRLVVFTKSDLADPKETDKWIEKLSKDGNKAIFADLNNPSDIKNIIKEASKLGEAKHQKQISRGMKPQPIRAMVLGIPNVGKSTLINKIAKRKSASVENKPGHTKSQQWIKVSNLFELLDTPGVLQSRYDDELTAKNLALVGSINENILPLESLADSAMSLLKESYPNLLTKRFDYLNAEMDNFEAFKLIAEKRGYLLKGGLDIAKAQKVFLNEFKNGLIGRITIERV